MNDLIVNDLIENQREKTKDAAREGYIASGIIEYLRGCPDGVGTRQGALGYLQDIVGLTDEERSITHVCPSGYASNYFETKVGYTVIDLRDGLYGEEMISGIRERGIWELINFQISPEKIQQDAKTYIQRKEKRDKKEDGRRWVQISMACKDRPEKEILSKILGETGREKIVEHVYLAGDDIEAAIDLLIEQYSL